MKKIFILQASRLYFSSSSTFSSSSACWCWCQCWGQSTSPPPPSVPPTLWCLHCDCLTCPLIVSRPCLDRLNSLSLFFCKFLCDMHLNHIDEVHLVYLVCHFISFYKSLLLATVVVEADRATKFSTTWFSLSPLKEQKPHRHAALPFLTLSNTFVVFDFGRRQTPTFN